ncbi:MAG: DUF721 domain-containing protein [Nitrococcus mobilis]|nr:DUF721 domain-containing protein [Nitrococcus mobilis]
MTAFDDHPRGCRRPQSLRWWLRADHGVLARIAHSARTNTRLQHQLQAVLPPELAGHWRVARLDAQALCLITENPLWATQLRYRRMLLLRGAEAVLGQRPRQLQLRIEPNMSARRPPPPARLLSANAAETLRRSAASMDQGPLRAALLRLASRHRAK